MPLSFLVILGTGTRSDVAMETQQGASGTRAIENNGIHLGKINGMIVFGPWEWNRSKEAQKAYHVSLNTKPNCVNRGSFLLFNFYFPTILNIFAHSEALPFPKQ